jgi:hypothetical protein
VQHNEKDKPNENDENASTPVREEQIFTNDSPWIKESLPLLTLLQHFSVYTNQTHNDMTYLLLLLKHYQPEPDYESLPNTGQELIKIDGRDWDSRSVNGDKTLPSPTQLSDGSKYMHFGLEKVFYGDSPGVVHKEADLYQFVSVYKENPELLPLTMKRKVQKYILF